MPRPLPEDLVSFIQTHLISMWALRLMLTLKTDPDRTWTAQMLVRELRANDVLVSGLLDRFQLMGLSIKNDEDVWCWRPATPELETLAQGVAEAYAVTPFSVIQTIAAVPENRLRQFSDAFKLRKD
jgi:hypothetical protein